MEMVFCEIKNAIYHFFLLLIILKICTCQLFQQPRESQDLDKLLLHWSMTKRICLQKCIIHYNKQNRIELKLRKRKTCFNENEIL